MSLDSMHKKLKNFHKNFTNLKNVIQQTDASKKDKYNEEINSLNTKDRK